MVHYNHCSVKDILYAADICQECIEFEALKAAELFQDLI
jgi:hypothetical protein